MNKALLMLGTKTRDLYLGEEGQDLIEYALLVCLITVGLIASLNGIASTLGTFFSTVSTDL